MIQFEARVQIDNVTYRADVIASSLPLRDLSTEFRSKFHNDSDLGHQMP